MELGQLKRNYNMLTDSTSNIFPQKYLLHLTDMHFRTVCIQSLQVLQTCCYFTLVTGRRFRNNRTQVGCGDNDPMDRDVGTTIISHCVL
jgi:hypothetical protein